MIYILVITPEWGLLLCPDIAQRDMLLLWHSNRPANYLFLFSKSRKKKSSTVGKE
jgi:prepilin-type processing-associated H-X9-DG protein